MAVILRLFVVCLVVLTAGRAWAELPDFRELVKETSPAVVNISTVQHARSTAFQQRYGLPDDVPEIFRHFFGQQIPLPGGKQESASLGSGFILSLIHI